MQCFVILLTSIFIILTGCVSQSQGENNYRSEIGEQTGSYEAILRINGTEYSSVGNVNQGKYTIDKEIGKVEKKVPPEVLPKENFVSNYLGEGATIYSVEEGDEVYLVKTAEGTYEVFE